MNRTANIINVLDDSRNKSIEYKNRFWLQQNVEKLDIRVCVEDCVVDDVFVIVHEFEKDGGLLVQEGERIINTYSFNPSKEALLLIENRNEEFDEKGHYLIFLYSPQ